MHLKNLTTARYVSCFIAAVIGIFLFLEHPLAAPVHIRILHVNDFHGYAEPHRSSGSRDLWGGAAYLADGVERFRRGGESPVLLLAAGDMIQGNPWSNQNHGKAVIELMNMMRFDAMVVGNHEFDFGQEVLKARISEARFPVLGANVSAIPGLKPYVVTDVGGVRVGILGIVTEQTRGATHPKNVKGLVFTTPVAACQRYLDEVRRQSDVVIVLSHIGFGEDRLLASEVKGIDAIVGGHSHTKVQEPPVIGETIVVQAWEHGKALGILDLTIEDGKVTRRAGRLETIRPVAGHGNQAVSKMVAGYARAVDRDMKTVIGKSCADLDGEHVRTAETNLGNMIADVMRTASGADIGLMNGGGIRTTIPKGTITLKDIWSVLPFNNYLVVLKLQGRHILQALEHGMAKVERSSGAFLQVSGMEMIYKGSDPPGSRVKMVWIDGQLLDLDKEYRVAMNDFIAAGGDGFEFLKDFPPDSIAERGQLVSDLVIDYIRGREEVCPRIEGRIRRLEEDRRVRQ